MADFYELEERARAALAERGLVVDGELKVSFGRNDDFTRCGTEDKPHRKNAEYKLYMDEPPCILIRRWDCGDEKPERVPLYGKGEFQMTAEERLEKEREWKAKAEAAKVAKEKRQRDVAEAVRAELKALPPAGDENPYLKHKGVHAVPGLYQDAHSNLVIPAYNALGEILTVQRVHRDGLKLFEEGGESKGTYFPIAPKKSGPLYLAEGIATALSIYEATGADVLSCFDCGHLMDVAKMAKDRYPDRDIIIAGDNDTTKKDADGKLVKRMPEDNAGRIKAMKAAEAIGARCVICPEVDDRKTDFNDLHQARGLDAVRKALAVAEPVEQAEQQEEAPIPLRRAAGEKKPYPMAAFGDFAQTIVDLSHYSKTPPVMAGNGILAAGSIACMGLGNVATESHGWTPLALYILPVITASCGKGTVEKPLMYGIREFFSRWVTESAEKETLYKIELETWTSEDEELKRLKVPKECSREEKIQRRMDHAKKKPVQPYTFNVIRKDIAYDGMLNAFQNETPIIGIVVSEGGQFFEGFGFSRDQKGKFLSALCSAFSDEELDKTRGGMVIGKRSHPRVTSYVQVQEDIFDDMLNDGEYMGKGYLPRNMISKVGAFARIDADEVDYRKIPSVIRFNEACVGLLEMFKANVRFDENREIIFPVELSLRDDARSEYIRYRNYCESEKFAQYSTVTAFCGRSAEQALRIAGILTLLHDRDCRIIPLKWMSAGITIAKWYLDETVRILADETTPQEILDAEKVLNVLHAEGLQYTSSNQLENWSGTGVRTKKEADAVIKTLVEHNWLIKVKDRVIVPVKKVKLEDGTETVKTVTTGKAYRVVYAVQD